MLSIEQNKELSQYNTMRLNIQAQSFCQLHSLDDALALSRYLQAPENDALAQGKIILLGGGSNVIFKGDLKALVIHQCSQGIALVEETQDNVLLKVQAGHNWDDFVAYCVQSGFYGVENLSLIPGTVGAAPIQNIGAYGQEVKDTLEQVDYLDLRSGEQGSVNNAECQFAYRDSIFKRQAQADRLITAVYFRLSKNFKPNITYKPLADALQADVAAQTLSAQALRDTVIAIRQSKLPDPKVLANTGSFFKNPVVANSLAEQIKKDYPNLPTYPIDDQHCKLAAGFLIEQAGFKGKRADNQQVGMHAKQALVLVNYGQASAEDLIAWSTLVRKTVQAQFGVSLEQEPVLIG